MKRIMLGYVLPLAAAALLAPGRMPGRLPPQEPSGAGSSLKPSSASAPSATGSPVRAPLADFAWLEGNWQGAWGQRVAQEAWMAPKAGVMVGTFWLVDNQKTLVIELFTILGKPGGAEFRFRHFTPGLVPWEKSEATTLELKSIEPRKITFENPLDGEPKRVIITRLDDDTFVSRSEIVPKKGDPQVIEITYHRQKQGGDQAAPAPNGQR